MARFYVFSKDEILGSAGEIYSASSHETVVERTVQAINDGLFDWATVCDGGPSGFPQAGCRQTFVMPVPRDQVQ